MKTLFTVDAVNTPIGDIKLTYSCDATPEEHKANLEATAKVIGENVDKIVKAMTGEREETEGLFSTAQIDKALQQAAKQALLSPMNSQIVIDNFWHALNKP